MTFESEFHEIVENTLTKRAWKVLGDEIGLHRRRQLMQQPSRASNAEVLVFEKLTQTPAAVLITKYELGGEVLTVNERYMHTQRNQHNLILPPYDSITTTIAGTAGATTNTVVTRNKRTIAAPEVATP